MNRIAHFVTRAVLAGALLASFSGTSLARDADPDACGSKGNSTLKPGTGKDLYVKDGVCTVSAGIYNYGAVTIFPNAELRLTDANIELSVKSIVVQDKGILSAATKEAPVGTLAKNNRVVVRFVGDRPPPIKTHAHAHSHAEVMAADDCSTINKGIAVMSGGALRLFGKRGVAPDDGRSARIGGPNPGSLSWTYLAKPAGSTQYQSSTIGIGKPVDKGGETTLYVSADVSNDWLPEDWIVVGTTSYSPFESEFVKIAKDAKFASVDGAIEVKLDPLTPLRHYHFGSPDPGRPSSANANDGETTNYGVDERAEVGLVTRNVVLTAAMPPWNSSPDTDNLTWGGETKFCKGFTEAKLQGVEIEKFGKDSLGSYPIHLHMVGDVPAGAALFNSNSVHHSYNHCFTLHMTNNVTVSNNVCARIIGHIFYEEVPKGVALANTGIKYHDNLGLGAMANLFGIAAGVPTVKIDGVDRPKDYWEGDYLARTGEGYHGLHIPNTDDQNLAVGGQCYTSVVDGTLIGADTRPCTATKPYYFEPPTGFWTVNPATEMIGNSIGGCQSLGRAWWYVPPGGVDGLVQFAYQPIGKFVNNRAHGCYDGIFGETEEGVTNTVQLQPKVGGSNAGRNIIARFDAFTAFRIRNRGVWLRPSWFVFEHARVATSREGMTLVTSGGLDGNMPGVWGLIKGATIVGVSKNNVDRWGPCPGIAPIESHGCVDQNPLAMTPFLKGYPSPAWNFAGIYIYDGPVRMHDTRFVNFHVDPTKQLLTQEDVDSYKKFVAWRKQTLKVYEGDAALGWFQNNQSAYPTATDARNLKFDSVDLRHQVFTEEVNFGEFDDGDKNTAIIDRDGSLTGFKLVAADGKTQVHDGYPISLNNLPINATGNAVDECHAEGAQDTIAEKRPTSLISPGFYGTLEFEAFMFTPDGRVPALGKPLTQLMTFAKDTTDYGKHQLMTLHSRNNQGIWEPKVATGHGYTVSVKDATDPKYKDFRVDPGIPPLISVGITDIVMPNIGKTTKVSDTFYVRVGVCYTGKTGHPDDKFDIKRGYRSWGGGPITVSPPDAELRQKYIELNNAYNGEQCYNLSDQHGGTNLNDPDKGCPAHGVFAAGSLNTCPGSGLPPETVNGEALCVYKPTTLEKAATYRDLTNEDGTPKSLDKYFYDKATGMLFFYVKQDRPNAVGTSPLGSCPGDSACPNPNDPTHPESYYACPPEGCPTYTVRLNDPGYAPIASACTTADPTSIYAAKPEYAQKPIKDLNQLAFVGSGTGFPDSGLVEAIDNTSTAAFPHRQPGFAGTVVKPNCPGAPSGVSFNSVSSTQR